MKQNLLKLSMLLLCLVMGLSSAWAEEKTQEIIFNTEAGFAEVTITTAGAASTGADYEFSQGDITVTGKLGYIYNKKHSVFKNGTMVITAGGNPITKVDVTYNSACFPFEELPADLNPAGEKNAGKTSSIQTKTLELATAQTSVTFNNKATGKTEIRAIKVYYTSSTSAVNVTGVTLNKNTASINIGETETLTATVAPSNATNKGVTWSSSDTKIATVSTTGVVKGIGAGTATITVTTKDGSKTATCEVTVTAVDVTKVTLDKTSIEVMAGLSEKLTATIAPENASNKKVTWTSSDEAVATVDANGLVKGVAEGTATITATTDDGGFTATCNVTVKKYEKPSKIEILFAPSTTDNDGSAWKATSAVNSVFSSGYDYVSEITKTENVYPARNSLVNGAKFGTSSAAGTITFSLSESMNVYKIIVSAAPYGDSEGFEGFTINGQSVSMTDGINKKYADYVVDLDGSALSSITITQNKANKGRIYIKGITLMLEDKDVVAYSAKLRNLTAQDSDKKYYATFSSTSPVFFPTTVTVSTVNIEGGAMSVTPLEITSATIDDAEVKGCYVPANTGVLISSSANKANYYTVYGYTPAALTGNMLRPATAEMTGDYKFYRLAYDDINTKTNLGFYYGVADGAAYTCKAGLAYLAVPTSSAAKSFTFDQATSIKSVTDTTSKVVYNLNGQRLSGLQKGINIVEGKKIFVK